jgi:hypothetical protein
MPLTRLPSLPTPGPLRESYAQAAREAAARAAGYAQRAAELAEHDPAFARRYEATGRPAEFHAQLAAGAAERAGTAATSHAAAEERYAAELAAHAARHSLLRNAISHSSGSFSSAIRAAMRWNSTANSNP